MDFSVWLAFFAASWAISLSPGAGAVAAMSAGLSHGFKRGYFMTFGLILGILTQVVLVSAGLGALIAASSLGFAIVKWAGVAYLIFLGVQQWRAPAKPLAAADEGAAQVTRRQLVLRGWGINAVNPKGTVFLLAVVPQFLDLHAPLGPQYLVIGCTLAFTDLVVMAGYTALAARVLAALKSESHIRTLNRVFGSLFVAAGALLATFKARGLMAGANHASPNASRLPTWVLFLGPVLIWASTWHVILYQLNSPVPALTSVGWRFAIAALMLAGLARWQGASLRLPRSAHGFALTTGVVQYAGNYWAVYEAERYVPSGLVAVLFCLMVFMNAAGAWLLWKQPVSRRFLVASSGAVLGVALVFWPEIASTGARPDAALGLGLSFFAVVVAVIGGFCTLVLTRRGLPLVPVLAWSMGYGAVFLLVLSAALGHGLPFDGAWTYVGSLLYLAAFGSVVAFTLYYKLVERRGPAHAALVGVMVPVIALLVSALFEGWQATPLAIGGMVLCLASLFVATRPQR